MEILGVNTPTCVENYLKHLAGEVEGVGTILFDNAHCVNELVLLPFSSAVVISSKAVGSSPFSEEGDAIPIHNCYVYMDGVPYTIPIRLANAHAHTYPLTDDRRQIFASSDVYEQTCLGYAYKDRIILGFDLEFVLSHSDVQVRQYEPGVVSAGMRRDAIYAFLDGALKDHLRAIVRANKTGKQEARCRSLFVDWKLRWANEYRDISAREAAEATAKAKNAWYEYVHATANAERLNAAVRAHDMVTVGERARAAVQEWEGVNALVQVKKVRDVRLAGNVLEFDTDVIEIESERTGNTCSLGPFHVTVPLTGMAGELTMTPHFDAERRDGYYHPHISSAFTPCLGNAAEILATAIAHYEIGGIIHTVLHFLGSYNDANPYISLERFTDPDDDDYYDEETARYDRCLENASYMECVDCRDRDCPHQEDAEERCAESSNMQDCACCVSSRCSRREDAQRECYDDHYGDRAACIECSGCSLGNSDDAQIDCIGEQSSPRECVHCLVRCCPRAGDTDLCFAYVQRHGLASCANCDVAHCEHLVDEVADGQQDMFSEVSRTAEPAAAAVAEEVDGRAEGTGLEDQSGHPGVPEDPKL